MASLISASIHLGYSPQPFPFLNNFHSAVSVGVSPAKRRYQQLKQGGDGRLFLGCGSNSFGVLRRCRRFETDDPERYAELEEEVRQFMKTSKKPHLFPTKRELVEGGRADLAEEIYKRGGWMTAGWDLIEERENFEMIDWRAGLAKLGFGSKRQRERSGSEKTEGEKGNGDEDKIRLEDDSGEGSGLKQIGGEERNGLELNVEEGSMAEENEGEEKSGLEEIECEEESGLEENEAAIVEQEGSFISGDPVPAASSSGASIELIPNEDTGVEGILNRLEKQRNSTFGLNLEKPGDTCILSSQAKDLQYSGTFTNVDSCYPERSDLPTCVSPDQKHFGTNGSFQKIDGLENSLKSDTWRTWSIRRSGSADREFEAGEINFEEMPKRKALGSPVHEVIARAKDVEEPSDTELKVCGEKISPNPIKARLHNLEQELSSMLRLLRSNSGVSEHEGQGSSLALNELYDELEFQQDKTMHARDDLRSTRAKTAVLEGKMALAVIDARRTLAEKQRKIYDARKALQFLRTISIVWPNAGSEVFVAGSFDGWSSQRRMTKSSAGVFSITLKLYPGLYEIKFIVDGVWKIDSLRPVSRNDGYENNLFTVS